MRSLSSRCTFTILIHCDLKGERSPNHHGVNGRFCPFNGYWSRDLYVLRIGRRPRISNLSALARWVMFRRAFLGVFSIGAHRAPSSMPYSICILRPIGGTQNSRSEPLSRHAIAEYSKKRTSQEGVPDQTAKFPQARSSGRRCWQTPSPQHPSARAPPEFYPTANTRPKSWRHGRPSSPGPYRQYW